jgi:putative spermidine/putrescine transport system ATP-binding protein
MVFQHYALFPHMKVRDNIAFPLKMRRAGREEIAAKVREVLALVAMPEFADRYPGELSGGQQQRVALARAIVFGPRLLLLDEPFGALDRKLRETMQLEVRRLQRRLNLTTLFITHDQEEALIMSDRIAVIRDGEVKQVGSPEEIYSRPCDTFIADFVGESNLISGRIVRIEQDRATIAGPCGRPITACVEAGFSAGEEVSVLLRPELPRLAEAPSSLANEWHGRIVESVYLGNSVKYRIATADGVDLLVRWPAASASSRLTIGCEISVGWSASDGHVVRRTRG